MKAVIFDLDGVIVDTARYHFLAWQRLASELGISLTEEYNEKLKGVGRFESLALILELGNITLPLTKMEELASRKNEWFVEYIQAMKREEIFSGAKALFKELRKNQVKIGLASSSKNAKTVLEKLEITSEFLSIVDGTMIHKSKPHPEIFLQSAEKLGESPSNCIVVEDAEAGVEAALHAHMKCVGIGKNGQLKKANLVVSSINELSYPILNNL